MRFQGKKVDLVGYFGTYIGSPPLEPPTPHDKFFFFKFSMGNSAENEGYSQETSAKPLRKVIEIVIWDLKSSHIPIINSMVSHKTVHSYVQVADSGAPPPHGFSNIIAFLPLDQLGNQQSDMFHAFALLSSHDRLLAGLPRDSPVTGGRKLGGVGPGQHASLPLPLCRLLQGRHTR